MEENLSISVVDSSGTPIKNMDHVNFAVKVHFVVVTDTLERAVEIKNDFARYVEELKVNDETIKIVKEY